MGLFGGTKTTTTDTKVDMGPSNWQKPYLDTAMQGAQTAYNNAAGTPYYQGDTYAGMSEEAKKALEKMKSFASGTGMDAATNLTNIGNNLAGYATKSGDMVGQYVDLANGDATQENMDAANRYAANPFIDGMIDANSRDITRNLTENQLPGIDRAASATGNINSSRAGVAAGVARRGAEDRIGDISAQMRGDAYDRGLTLAQNDRSTKMDAYKGAADAYGNLGQTGMTAIQAGAQAGYGAQDQINKANAIEQADRQGLADQDFAQWQGQDSREFDLLNKYYGIVGSNSWGQSGTTTEKKVEPTGGILGGIVGAVTGLAGAAGGLGFKPFSDPRLKKEIRKIGELEDGLGIYTWSYIWEPDGTINVGVMADEVAVLRPWALGETINGFMTVKYEEL